MGISTLIKYFFIALCGFYVICKLQNFRPSKLQMCLIFVGSILSALIYLLAKSLVPSLYIMALIVPFILASKIILKQPFKKIVPLGLSSIAVSFVLATISVFFIGLLTYIIRLIVKFNDGMLFKIIVVFVIGLFQILFTFAIFKIKRFSRGIPDIDKFLDSDLTMFISTTIILFMSFAEIKNNDNILSISIAFVLGFLGIILFFAWRMRFNKIYIKRQMDKEVNELENAMQILESKNKEIIAENEAMASVVHRDNKTISAFINSLTDISMTTKDQTTKQQLITFLDYLHSEHSERLHHLSKNNTLPVLSKTNMFAVDGMLEFMQNKALQNGIDLALILDCDISTLTHDIINETDLVTLLADLLDNAIIATKSCYNKKIEVCFSLKADVYELKISDSGIPFEPVVLENFGTKKVTTHQNEGGSGIGLVTIYEIIKKVNASLLLVQGEKNYTKTISILFDNQCKLSITNNFTVKE